MTFKDVIPQDPVKIPKKRGPKPGKRVKRQRLRFTDAEKSAILGMKAQGLTTTDIATRMDRSSVSIWKQLRNKTEEELMAAFSDPNVQAAIIELEKNELNDLATLGYKARRNLHKLADAGKMRPIENIALMDRAFQQKRLLQGKSTQNVNSLTYLITKAAEAREARMREGGVVNGSQEQEGKAEDK